MVAEFRSTSSGFAAGGGGFLRRLLQPALAFGAGVCPNARLLTMVKARKLLRFVTSGSYDPLVFLLRR
jgi:hypothetical protein